MNSTVGDLAEVQEITEPSQKFKRGKYLGQGVVDMKFLHTTAFTGLIFFILGATSMVTVQRFILKPKYTHSAPLVSSKQMDPFFDRFFNDDFFGRSRDPFEDLRQMREGMMKQFDHDQGVGLFDSWYKKKFGGGSAGDIKQREDSHFVYYDISIDGLKGDKVDVKVLEVDRFGKIKLSIRAIAPMTKKAK